MRNNLGDAEEGKKSCRGARINIGDLDEMVSCSHFYFFYQYSGDKYFERFDKTI